MKIVLVTGGFDPLHSGHIEYFKAAKQLGDKLVVGLNSDDWLARKKGQPFMPWHERATIAASINYVDRVINFDDSDGTAIDAIRKTKEIFPNHEIIFANGGDRTKNNVPEMIFDDIEFVFGVGGENKLNSSSWILREWKEPKTLREWGYYRILHDVSGCKVKELTIEPGKSLSLQKHKLRNEYWIVTHGECQVEHLTPNGFPHGYVRTVRNLKKHDNIFIFSGDWHRLSNPHDKICRIVEIQYGIECTEEDIERKDA